MEVIKRGGVYHSELHNSRVQYIRFVLCFLQGDNLGNIQCVLLLAVLLDNAMSRSLLHLFPLPLDVVSWLCC